MPPKKPPMPIPSAGKELTAISSGKAHNRLVELKQVALTFLVPDAGEGSGPTEADDFTQLFRQKTTEKSQYDGKINEERQQQDADYQRDIEGATDDELNYMEELANIREEIERDRLTHERIRNEKYEWAEEIDSHNAPATRKGKLVKAASRLPKSVTKKIKQVDTYRSRREELENRGRELDAQSKRTELLLDKIHTDEELLRQATERKSLTEEAHRKESDELSARTDFYGQVPEEEKIELAEKAEGRLREFTAREAGAILETLEGDKTCADIIMRSKVDIIMDMLGFEPDEAIRVLQGEELALFYDQIKRELLKELISRKLAAKKGYGEFYWDESGAGPVIGVIDNGKSLTEEARTPYFDREFLDRIDGFIDSQKIDLDKTLEEFGIDIVGSDFDKEILRSAAAVAADINCSTVLRFVEDEYQRGLGGQLSSYIPHEALNQCFGEYDEGGRVIRDTRRQLRVNSVARLIARINQEGLVNETDSNNYMAEYINSLSEKYFELQNSSKIEKFGLAHLLSQALTLDSSREALAEKMYLLIAGGYKQQVANNVSLPVSVPVRYWRELSADIKDRIRKQHADDSGLKTIAVFEKLMEIDGQVGWEPVLWDREEDLRKYFRLDDSGRLEVDKSYLDNLLMRNGQDRMFSLLIEAADKEQIAIGGLSEDDRRFYNIFSGIFRCRRVPDIKFRHFLLASREKISYSDHRFSFSEDILDNTDGDLINNLRDITVSMLRIEDGQNNFVYLSDEIIRGEDWSGIEKYLFDNLQRLNIHDLELNSESLADLAEGLSLGEGAVEIGFEFFDKLGKYLPKGQAENIKIQFMQDLFLKDSAWKLKPADLERIVRERTASKEYMMLADCLLNLRHPVYKEKFEAGELDKLLTIEIDPESPYGMVFKLKDGFFTLTDSDSQYPILSEQSWHRVRYGLEKGWVKSESSRLDRFLEYKRLMEKMGFRSYFEYQEEGRYPFNINSLATLEKTTGLNFVLHLDKYFNSEGKIKFDFLFGLDSQNRRSALEILAQNPDLIERSKLGDNLLKAVRIAQTEGLEDAGNSILYSLLKNSDSLRRESNIYMSEAGEVVIDIGFILGEAANEEINQAYLFWEKQAQLARSDMAVIFNFREAETQARFETLCATYRELKANFPEDRYLHFTPSKFLKSVQEGLVVLKKDKDGQIQFTVGGRNFWALYFTNPDLANMILENRLPDGLSLKTDIPGFFKNREHLRDENWLLVQTLYNQFRYSGDISGESDNIFIFERDGSVKVRQSIVERMMYSKQTSDMTRLEVLKVIYYDQAGGMTLGMENEQERGRYKVLQALRELALESEDKELIDFTFDFSRGDFRRFTDKMVKVMPEGKVQITVNEDLLRNVFSAQDLDFDSRISFLHLVFRLIDKPLDSANLRTVIELGERGGEIGKFIRTFEIEQQGYNQRTYLGDLIFRNSDLETALSLTGQYFDFPANGDDFRPRAKETLLIRLMEDNPHIASRYAILTDFLSKNLIDLSDREQFSRRAHQFWELFARDSELAKTLERYLISTDDHLIVDYANFNKDFRPQANNANGVRSWEYNLSKPFFDSLRYARDKDDLVRAYRLEIVDLPNMGLEFKDEFYWQEWGKHTSNHEFMSGLNLLRDWGLTADLAFERGQDSTVKTSVPVERIIKLLRVHQLKEEGVQPLMDLINNPRLNEILDLAEEFSRKAHYISACSPHDITSLLYLADHPVQKEAILRLAERGYIYNARSVELMLELNDKAESVLDLIKKLQEESGFKTGNLEADVKVIRKLLDNPVQQEAIRRLNPFGFQFNSIKYELIEAIAPRIDEITADLEEVKALSPAFEYQPVSVNRLSVYANLEAKNIRGGNFSIAQLKRIAKEKVNTGLQSGDYETLQVIALQKRIEIDFLPAIIAENKHFTQEEVGKLREAVQSGFYQTKDGRQALVNFMIEAAKSLDAADAEKLITLLPKAEPLIMNRNLHSFILKHLDTLYKMPAEKIGSYKTVLERIMNSPSQEILRLKEELLNQVMETENPEETYSLVEDIFIKNNLPLMGKIYRIVEILHPPNILKNKIDASSSPILERSRHRRRLYTIYRDLLKIHLDSGNRSLRSFLEVLKSGQNILNKLDGENSAQLDYRDRLQLTYFFDKMDTLYENSLLGKARRIERHAVTREDILARYQVLLENLGVSEGQTLVGRIEEMFLAPIGIGTIDEALARMDLARSRADARGRAIFETAQNGRLNLQAGDLLKGVGDQYIQLIMQNGSVAKECLGSSSTTDLTPFDTDVSIVFANEAESGWETVLENTLSKGYGDLIFCFKDRGQFQKTVYKSTEEDDTIRYELFKTGKLGERHYGIRTGIPTTEIDFMIVQPGLRNDRGRLEKIFYTIAQNGYYVPVTDFSGQIIFTPDDFDSYRRAFAGIERYGGDDMEVARFAAESSVYQNVQEMVSLVKKDREKVAEMTLKARTRIEEALSEMDIHLKDEFDQSILGAELFDTGSTGRGTNTPGDYDFDLSLTIDGFSFRNVGEIAKLIKSKLRPLIDKSHAESSYYQIRAIGATGIAEDPIDVDVGIASQSDLREFASHDAIQAKLEHIKKKYGEDAYFEVTANIITAKKILKEGQAYKKMEQGGLGGIGVETWILLNGGNFVEAFKSFYQTAHEDGKKIAFADFQARYPIRDAGMNIKFLNYDNYVYSNLKENGYNAMLETIEAYFG